MPEASASWNSVLNRLRFALPQELMMGTATYRQGSEITWLTSVPSRLETRFWKMDEVGCAVIDFMIARLEPKRPTLISLQNFK